MILSDDVLVLIHSYSTMKAEYEGKCSEIDHHKEAVVKCEKDCSDLKFKMDATMKKIDALQRDKPDPKPMPPIEVQPITIKPFGNLETTPIEVTIEPSIEGVK